MKSRKNHSYTGSTLLWSVGQRLLLVTVVVGCMWLLSAWALGWL